jgi:hypothetical protein
LRKVAPGEEEKIKRFEKSLPNLAEKCGKTRSPIGHKFVTIAHGDLWSNNVLFLYGPQNEVVDFRVIDFQVENSEILKGNVHIPTVLVQILLLIIVGMHALKADHGPGNFAHEQRKRRATKKSFTSSG